MKISVYLMSIVVIVGCILPLVSGFAESAPPPEEHTTYISSSKSVFVSQFQPSTNFNTGSNRYYLDVGEDEFTYSFVSFVAFDLSELPDDADIQSAEIGLYLANDPKNIPVKMFKTRESWGEDSVTWNTKPSYKDLSKTQGLIDSVTVSSTGRTYWEATNTVKGWYNGSITNYGVAFESTGTYFHRFSSDETTYYKPLLTVIYMSSSGGGSGEPPEPPEDSEPCEISYTISPASPQSGDSVTLTATATDNIGLEYLIIKEGSIERCSEYAPDDETTTLTCVYTETLYAPGKTFIIEANDKGGSPPQSITLPISVTGSGSAPEIELSIEYRDQNAIPSFYRLLPSDNQTVNITATATDPDGIRYLTITVNSIPYDFSFDPAASPVTRTVHVVNDDPSLATFRYSAAATDLEGFYNSTTGDVIEIRTPFQWYWGLNFSNWGCDKNHTWSWSMMESIYGDSDIYLDKSKGWKKDWAWRLYDAKIRKGGRNGHCFGMCTLALELAHAPARITPIEIQDTATHVDALEKTNWNTTWRYYFARQSGQYSAEVSPRVVAQYLDLYFTDWVASGWTGMHPYLDDLLDTIGNDLEDGDFGILSIREGSSGHAVVPWRIVPGDTDESITRLYIYDPNHKHVSYHHETDYSVFDHYPFIECNVNTHIADWWMYQWNATSTWDDEIMYFTYEEAIGDVGQLNYIDSTDITDHDIPGGISYLVAIGSGDSSYYAQDAQGRKTGIVDGVLVSEIPDAVPLVGLADTLPTDNLMLYLPEDTELTFYFDTPYENGNYTFSCKNHNSTYSLINKTIVKNTEETLRLIPRQTHGDYELGISGTGDENFSVKITKEYQDTQGKPMAREYTVYKNSTNEHEEIRIRVSDDKKSLVITNTNNEDTMFNVEFRSTEALDTIAYIPTSTGTVTILKNQGSTVTPEKWDTTETQARITVATGENTPGFEMLSCVFVIMVLMVIYRRKYSSK